MGAIIPDRTALNMICGAFGYDPATVQQIMLTQFEIVITYRVSRPDGTFGVMQDGFLIPGSPAGAYVAPFGSDLYGVAHDTADVYDDVQVSVNGAPPTQGLSSGTTTAGPVTQ